MAVCGSYLMAPVLITIQPTHHHRPQTSGCSSPTIRRKQSTFTNCKLHLPPSLCHPRKSNAQLVPSPHTSCPSTACEHSRATACAAPACHCSHPPPTSRLSFSHASGRRHPRLPNCSHRGSRTRHLPSGICCAVFAKLLGWSAADQGC